MNNYLINSLYIFLGAGFGALLRYLMVIVVPNLQPIMLVNILGSFVIGYTSHKINSPELRHLVNTGFLGGLTTFSTFSLEILNFGFNQEFIKASLYAILSVFLGLVACYLGYKL
ncbi:MAG: CrcB family protein [Candidatus Caenarcaniphilales bacterium]|jgi:CrcB protein|nr:CrcB family protein [Candidatus Caenarcaniphilales bacterium]